MPFSPKRWPQPNVNWRRQNKQRRAKQCTGAFLMDALALRAHRAGRLLRRRRRLSRSQRTHLSLIGHNSPTSLLRQSKFSASMNSEPLPIAATTTAKKPSKAARNQHAAFKRRHRDRAWRPHATSAADDFTGTAGD
jgi:hypothetical protein